MSCPQNQPFLADPPPPPFLSASFALAISMASRFSLSRGLSVVLLWRAFLAADLAAARLL